MGNISQNTYKLNPKVGVKHLIKHGFHGVENEYTYRFSVVKYGNKPSLECEITINYDDKRVVLNVYEAGTNDEYTPFYHVTYGNFTTILNTINGRIQNELHQIGIYKKKNNNRRKKMRQSVI